MKKALGWLGALGLTIAAGCETSEPSEPEPTVGASEGGSSEGTAAGEDTLGEASSDGEVLDPIAQRCHAAFITDEEIADCDEAMRDVAGDAEAILDACAQLELDNVRLRCLTAAAQIEWDVTEFVAECVDVAPPSEAHQCVSSGIDASWNLTGLPSACAQVFAMASQAMTCITFTSYTDEPTIDQVLSCAASSDPMSCVLGID